MNLYRKTLDHCGMHEEPATEEAVKNCFLDYVDHGAFKWMTTEDALDIVNEEPIEIICKNLLKTV